MCSPTPVKFMKSISLIMDVGTQALTCRLKREVQLSGSSSFDNFLNVNKHRLFHLYEKKNCCQCTGQSPRTKALTSRQWSMLFVEKSKSCKTRKPCLCQIEPQENISENDLDLSLLCSILLNVCSLDAAEAQDIKNLKEKRNYCFHSPNTNMDDTTFEEVSSSIKNSIESIANRCGDEVHSKVKGEIEKLMKSQMNDNMGRHVLSSLHNLEENFEDISQDMKDIKSHLGIREKLNVSHENIYEEPPRRNATKTSLSLYGPESYGRRNMILHRNENRYQMDQEIQLFSLETTPPEISRYEKIVADIHEARYTDCNFQYYMDKIFETSNFLRQTNREGFFDIDLAVENENLKIIHVLSIYWRYSKRLPPEICIFLCACKKGFIHIMEYILKKNGDILHKTDLRGWNAAHYAAQGGHIKLLELLLDKGVRFDQTTNEKESILHIASLNAKFEMCQFIITKFPQMRQECDKNGQNAIHLAALGGNIKILQFLVDKGVEIYQSNNKNSTVLHAACRNAHYDMSKYILCKYPEMLNLYNTDGWNAAHFAARGGEVKILQMLINEGEEIKLTYAERNILHIACQYAHFDMCNYILSKFPKMLECKCEDGWIAIHFAAKGGNRKILQMLLEKGALEKEITSAKKSILHIACVSSHYDICEYIVTNYPDILHWDDASGRNAVHFAAQGGNINILNLLLKNNANAKTITNTKKNILHIACENEKYDMCKKILYHFPDMLGKVDEVGRNAAHCAACGNNVNLLQLLIEKGVKADQTIDGEINILQLACSYGKYEMCQYILSKYPEMLKSCDAKGWNPAHYAALGGHVHILMLLVEKGINANHKLKGGMTILHIACANARYEMCQYILSEIPNMISEVDIRGRNAAHYAILQDNLGILKLLIEKELPNTNYQDNILNSVCAYARFDMCEYILSKYPNTINLVNKKGWNAAHSAARGGNVKILQLLLEKGIKANETTCDEENILDIACANAQYDICKYILSASKTTFYFDDEDLKHSALWASYGGNVDVLQLLMDNEVEVNQTSSGENNILHIACLKGRLKMCQFVLKKFPYMLDLEDNDGWNAAHFAARGGNVEILKLLINNNVQIYLTTNNQQNILHIACANGMYKMFQFILHEFQDMLHDIDGVGWNAALCAAQGGNVDILQELLTKKMEVRPASAKMNMLQVACAHGHFEMCRYIISLFPDMLHFVTKDGWNAAHYAAKGGNVDILKLILEKGVKGELTTTDGLNILHIACLNAKHQMCELIEERFQAMKFKLSKYGRNALYYAAKGENDPIVQFMIYKGVHLVKEYIYLGNEQ